MEKYEALGDELPIVKTIKIAHDSFRIRNCGMLTLDGVIAKINAVIPKIRKGAPFENKDHYFESKYRIHCQTMPCVPDELFETYIRDLCTRFIDLAAAKEAEDLSEKARKAAERETEQARRAESGELNKEDVRRRSKNGDDITEYYKVVLNENFQDMFRDAVDGYIEGSEPDTRYKIIYKQNGTIDYLELIEHSKTGVVRDRSYYSFAENEPVNSKGGELEYEYE
jgi:hypothetical protein